MKASHPISILVAVILTPILFCFGFGIGKALIGDDKDIPSPIVHYIQTPKVNNPVVQQIVYDTTYTYDTLICRLWCYPFVYDTLERNNIRYICKKSNVIIDSTFQIKYKNCGIVTSNSASGVVVQYKGNSIDCYTPLMAISEGGTGDETILNRDSDSVWVILKLVKTSISHI
jgi:hypothetical protein